MTHKGTRNYIMKEPYGITLIIAPWNYPLQLALAPAIGAIAAGNCIVLKPSELAQATSSLLKKMIQSTFDKSYFTVIEGDKNVCQNILKHKFDYIFFMGIMEFVKNIIKLDSKQVTHVTLF